MPGSVQSWDQSEDPRENTVDLPRIDLAGLADYFRGAAPPPRPAASAQRPPEEPESEANQAAVAELAAGNPPAPAVSAAAPTMGAPDPAVAGPAPVRPASGSAGASALSVLAPTVRPTAGSLPDLRSRLSRLPAGHPSSPYEDGGQARPLPTRLRQLELGLPAPGRAPGDGAASRAEDDDSGRYASPVADEPADFDLSTEPERAEPESEPETGSADADQLPATDAPRRDPQWQDPYATASDSNGHAPREGVPLAPAGSALAPWPGEGAGHSRLGRNSSRNENGNGRPDAGPEPRRPHYGPPDRGRPDHGRQHIDRDDHNWQDADWQDHDRPDVGSPPQSEWEQHDTRERTDPWQERELHHARPERDRPRPRPEPDRPDPRPERDRPGARLERDRPDPDLRPPGPNRLDRRLPDAAPPPDGMAELVERTLARCQVAEGRTMSGSYGSSGITPALHRLAAQLPAGGLAPGSDADSLKAPDRFMAKLSRLIARNPARSPAELAEAISDVVRYAFAFEAGDYTEGTWLVHRKLKTQGFELEARRNRWQNPEYKGIFTRWRDPAHGIAFEVQFHTVASWAVAKRTHDAYSRITDPATPPAERAQLRARQVAAAAGAKPPPGCLEIADFRGEPR
jgi:hypothetical protein